MVGFFCTALMVVLLIGAWGCGTGEKGPVVILAWEQNPRVVEILLTMSCIHVGLSIMDFLTSEGAMGGAGGGVLAMAKVPPEVKGGFAARPEAPGLGVDLNEENYKQRQGGRGGNTVPLDWI